jgi:hypothetical protein
LTGVASYAGAIKGIEEQPLSSFLIFLYFIQGMVNGSGRTELYGLDPDGQLPCADRDSQLPSLQTRLEDHRKKKSEN